MCSLLDAIVCTCHLNYSDTEAPVQAAWCHLVWEQKQTSKEGLRVRFSGREKEKKKIRGAQRKGKGGRREGREEERAKLNVSPAEQGRLRGLGISFPLSNLKGNAEADTPG